MHEKDGDSLLDPSELKHYLHRLGLSSLIEGGSQPAADRTTLSMLHKRHMACIPFENLALHYNTHPVISLRPEDVFERILGWENRGRGGYCYQLALLYCSLLRTLGYRVTTSAAKVFNYRHQVFGGWTHTILLVHLSENGHDSLVMTDITFGVNGPILPLSLDGDVLPALLQDHSRIAKMPIPTLSKLDEFYVVQHKAGSSPDGLWRTLYAFQVQEFTSLDYEIMNHWTCTSRKRWPGTRVFSYRIVLDGQDRPLGYNWLLDSRFTEHRNGEKRISEIKTEAERRERLQAAFGIELNEAEFQGIKNCITELPC